MLAPAEGAVAELALVLLLRLTGLASGGGRSVGGHHSRRVLSIEWADRSRNPRWGDGSTAGRAWALKRVDGYGEAGVSLSHSAKCACEWGYSTGKGR